MSTTNADHELNVHPYLMYLRIYPLFIAGICLMDMYYNVMGNGTEFFELLVSLVGISGSVLYLNKKPLYKKALHFWAAGQAIVFVVPFLNWNISQLYSYSFYMNFLSHSNEEYKFGVNFIGVAFLATNFYFNHLNYIFSLVGKDVKFSPIAPMANLKDMNHLLPASGRILKRIKIEKEDSWMLIKMNDLKGMEVDDTYMAIRGTDKRIFRPGSNSLLRVLKLKDVQKVANEKFNKEDFEFLGVVKGK